MSKALKRSRNGLITLTLVNKARAAPENAEIYWGDETGARNDCNHSRGYAPKGITPVVEINSKRFSINMISAINNQGLVRFMIYKNTMNAKILLPFFKRLRKTNLMAIIVIQLFKFNNREKGITPFS